MILKHVPGWPVNRTRRFVSVVLALGAFGLVLTACGGSGSATTTTTSSASKASGGASLSAFRQCLSKHGVSLPSFSGGGAPPSGAGTGTPPSGAGGASGEGAPPAGAGGSPGGGGFASNPKFAAAAKACSSVEPKGGFGGFGGGATNSSAFAAYRNCLKLHGVTLPSGTSGSTPSSIDTSSAAYQAAQTACAALRPSPGSTPSTASPASG
jgi:hypothetical protein